MALKKTHKQSIAKSKIDIEAGRSEFKLVCTLG